MDELLFWLNEIRSNHGLTILEREDALEYSTSHYANDLIERGILSHRDGKNRGPLERYNLLGGTALGVGEILGTKKLSQSIDILTNLWWQSEPHREQILNPRWNMVGLSSFEKDGVEIYVIQFSTSLFSELNILEEEETFTLFFNPLLSCDTLSFHDVIGNEKYSWKRGEIPLVVIKRKKSSLLLEVFQEEMKSPSNRILLY